MKTLVGDECPLLFGIWKPKKIQIFYPGDSRLSNKYHFDKFYIDITSEESHNFAQHYIDSRFNGPTWGMPIEEMFDKEFLQMYKDAKSFMQERLAKGTRKSMPRPDVDIEKYSDFSICHGLSVIIDRARTGNLMSVEESNAKLFEVYNSLEKRLIGEFGKKAEQVAPTYWLGFFKSGTTKLLDLTNGVAVVTTSPGDGDGSAGMMWCRVVSTEHGNPQTHSAVLETIKSHLNTNPTGLLDRPNTPRENCFCEGVSGDGPYWRIDLTRVPRVRGLSNGSQSLMGYLCETSSQ